MPVTPVTRERSIRPEPVTGPDERLRAVLRLHLHPHLGSAYWLRRQAELGWDVCDRVRSIGDLRLLGPTATDDLRRWPVRDFIPRTYHNRLDRFVTGETAGTSGRPCATAYRDDEFEAAFVTPFLRVADACGFPRDVPWLWVGPSGPHIIGKVVRELARRTGSIDPFSVDFDPRWAKRLADGALGRQRYLDHVTDQAVDILDREEIGVLFTTPPALAALAERLSDRQREAIRGVHYGGMAVTAEEVNEFRAVFPNAVHLAGYGNTLFGVAMELADGPRSAMDYYPLADRVRYEIVSWSAADAPGPLGRGVRGRVMFHRFDESCLLVNVLERDEAEFAPAVPSARSFGRLGDGLRDPRPPAHLAPTLRPGLY